MKPSGEVRRRQEGMGAVGVSSGRRGQPPFQRLRAWGREVALSWQWRYQGAGKPKAYLRAGDLSMKLAGGAKAGV